MGPRRILFEHFTQHLSEIAKISNKCTKGGGGRQHDTNMYENDVNIPVHFRLSPPEGRGVVASALFEFGAARETGELTRQAFVSTCTERLKLFTIEEAQ